MKKLVIIGGGFAGLTFARKIDKKLFDITVIDRNNYHQFQPLLYQVAISGIEPGSICFPLRGIFARYGIKFYMAEVTSIDKSKKCVFTDAGCIEYDYLVIAAGTITNYFNNTQVMRNSFPMKSAEDALKLRNRILENMEAASIENDPIKQKSLLRIVIVGGGATGVEIAGALAEVKRYIVPRYFPEFSATDVDISLIEGSGKLLNAMSQQSSDYALKSLEKMGIHVTLNTQVTNYENNIVTLNNGSSLEACLLIWVSGVIAEPFEGISKEEIGVRGRIITDKYLRLKDDKSVFAIGDIGVIYSDEKFIVYPQVAQLAIQQAKILSFNLSAIEYDKELKPFIYKDKGSMATIGKNKAVADIGRFRLKGFLAWLAWLIIHLRSILGVRNKIIILIDWIWNYFSYRKSTGLIFSRTKQQ